MQFIDNPCDCEEGFCPHYNQNLLGERYKLAHIKDKRGIAFRKDLLNIIDTNYKPVSKNTNQDIFYNYLSSFLISIISHIKNNFQKTTKEQKVDRLLICLDCEHKTKDWQCNLCGCLLELKTDWASESCPIKKWNKIELTTLTQTLDKTKSGCGCNN